VLRGDLTLNDWDWTTYCFYGDEMRVKVLGSVPPVLVEEDHLDGKGLQFAVEGPWHAQDAGQIVRGIDVPAQATPDVDKSRLEPPGQLRRAGVVVG
jgi:hypothetical protein